MLYGERLEPHGFSSFTAVKVSTTIEQIKEVFGMYGVESGVDSEFGDWVVSKDADVINVVYKYPIYTPQVMADGVEEWLDHMREKTWFDATQEADFLDAYNKAEHILGKTVI